MKPKHAALFAGIHGFSLAAQWAGIETLWHSEIDEFCNKVAAKRFPNSLSLGDIRNVTKSTAKPVTVISCGFPCQPWSVAGKRKGKDDHRWLGQEMFRVFRELQAPYILLENVAGFVSMALDDLLTEMESIGYTTEQFIIPACAQGAWHRRDRLWIVAYSDSFRYDYKQGYEQSHYPANIQQTQATQSFGNRREFETSGLCKAFPHSDSSNEQLLCRRYKQITQEKSHNSHTIKNGREYWAIEPGVGRMVHGIPNRVDRLRALGNAIVPQVAYQIFQAIKQHYYAE